MLPNDRQRMVVTDGLQADIDMVVVQEIIVHRTVWRSCGHQQALHKANVDRSGTFGTIDMPQVPHSANDLADIELIIAGVEDHRLRIHPHTRGIRTQSPNLTVMHRVRPTGKQMIPHVPPDSHRSRVHTDIRLATVVM